MRNLTPLIRQALTALGLSVILAPAAAHALASSESYTLTAGAFVASSSLVEASNENGSIQLLGSFIETGPAAGQSEGEDSGILMSNGWATLPIPVPEPGFSALFFAGLTFLMALLALRNRRAQLATRPIRPSSVWMLMALLLLLPSPAFAVPYDFSYQGTLADSMGDPLEGSVDIGIALFAQMVATPEETALYAEDHGETMLSENGGFSLMIGTGAVTTGSFGPSIFQTNNVYLEITIDGEVLSPRQPISSVPWALVADELADGSDLVNQVDDLEDQVGSFPAEGDIGAELASLSAALSAVQVQLGAISVSANSFEDQLSATAGHIAAVYNQIGNPLTSTTAPAGGTGSGIGIYDFAVWQGATGNPIIAHVDNGEGGVMMVDEFMLALTVCDDPSCDSSSVSSDLAYGNVESWTTCMEYETDPETGEEWCMWEEEEYGPETLEFPQVILGSDGFPLISYVDSAANTLKIIHCDDLLCPGSPTPITPTASGGGPVPGYGSDLALGADGLGVASYYDTAVGLLVLRCTNVDCSSQVTNTVDATVGASWSHRSSIAIGSDGLPVLAYHHGANQDLGFAHCENTSCGAGTTTAILDSVGNVGQNPVITIGSAGYPAIAYHDVTDSAIHLISCSDLACAGFTQETIATGVSSSNKISLQFSQLGTPTISWTDSPTDEVRVVSCPTPDCSLKGPHQTWVTDARDHSLVLNVDGDPVIAYLEDSWHGSLVIERLSDLQSQVVTNESAAGTAQSTASSALVTANGSQSAASTAQASADAAQAAIDSHAAPGCTTNLALDPSACPFTLFSPYQQMRNCEDALIGSYCEADGECSTDTDLDNCPGNYDVYYKIQ